MSSIVLTASVFLLITTGFYVLEVMARAGGVFTFRGHLRPLWKSSKGFQSQMFQSFTFQNLSMNHFWRNNQKK